MANYRDKIKDVTDEQLLREVVQRNKIGDVTQSGEIVNITINGMDLPEKGKINSERNVEFLFHERNGRLLFVNIVNNF